MCQNGSGVQISGVLFILQCTVESILTNFVFRIEINRKLNVQGG